jgi:hypothetical protein
MGIIHPPERPGINYFENDQAVSGANADAALAFGKARAASVFPHEYRKIFRADYPGDGGRFFPGPGIYIFGKRTASMTWITPFDCLTSAMVTLAVPPFSSVTVIVLPDC